MNAADVRRLAQQPRQRRAQHVRTHPEITDQRGGDGELA
jgi:hypothetical protein